MKAGKRGPLAKPRYRKGLDRWEVKADGKYVPILDEFGQFIRGDGRESEAKANAAWHLLLQRQQAPARGGDNLIAVVLDLYLDEVERLYPHRLELYKRTFQGFADLYPDLTVEKLRVKHIDAWFEAHPEWVSPNTRKTYLDMITAAFNWASEIGDDERIIPYEHPLRGMDLDRLKHKAYSRARGSDTRVEEQVHLFMMHNVPADLRQILFALRHSGTRPGNIVKVTAAHFLEHKSAWRFEEAHQQQGQTVHKTYDKTHEAIEVPLTEELVTLCKELCEKYPTGPLFRKKSGAPWGVKDIADRLGRLRKRFKRLGVPFPDVFFAYCYRHETVTTLVAGGESDAMAASVVNHRGTRTLQRHYNHAITRTAERVAALRRHVHALPGELVALRGDVADPEQPSEP